MCCDNPSYNCLYRYGLLGVLILLGISMGLWNEILSPTLPNLSAKLNVSYESMGYIMSIRSVGSVFALIFAAIVYDSYPFLVHYLMSVECLIAGIVTIIIPWSKYYWMVIIFFLIQTGSHSSINNGGQLTILRTFKEKSIGKMQIYHLGYGIGGVLSGLISQQFLSKTTSGGIKLTKYCMKYRALSPVSNTSRLSNSVKNNEKGFEYIYLIAGVFAICSAIIFLSYKSIRNPDMTLSVVNKKESWLQKVNPKYIADGKVLYGSIMTILLFFYYFFYMFGLLTFTPYIVVYAVDPCKAYTMTQRDATYLHMALNIFFLLGRVMGSFVIDRCPITALLIINILNIFFNFILVFLSHKYSMALWIGACGMRFCNSVVYPSGTSFMNRYIVVTSSLISLAFLGTTVGSFVGSSLGGYLVDNYPSHYITYSCLSGMSMLFVTTIMIVTLGSKNGVRSFSKESNVGQEPNKLELK